MVFLKQKLPYILAAVSLVSASSSVRGIAPEKSDLYKPAKDNTWTCLDGSKVIPYSAINDDYCDCADGSDEPGTSACPNNLFYCANVGHIPAYIKSYAVNDGVCDEACCDGSDENGDLISCPNRCKEVGEAYRKEQSSLRMSTKAGLDAKTQLVDEAQKQIAEWEEKQSKLEEEMILKKSNLLRLQRELKDLESRTGSSKKQKKTQCQSGALEVATLKHDIMILKKELNTLKNILGDMKRDHNHNFHDMAVKSAISGYDEFVARFGAIEAEIDDNLENININESEEAGGFQEEEEEEDDDVIDEEEKEEKQEADKEKSAEVQGKHSIVDVILEKLDPVLPAAMKNLLTPPKQVSDEKKPSSNKAALENTRNLVRDAENEVNSLESDLNKIKDDLAVDYGKDKEWLKLKNVCIEKDEGEYTYSLCFLGDAYQKSNKDSTRTHLGKFEKFDGAADGVYKVHVHSRGTRCWNGPERSVKATIECGFKNEILDVSEPEKCEYHFRMLSPAVCVPVEEDKHDDTTVVNKKPVHEEL